MKVIDLTKVLQGKTGKWVSISPDNKRIIADAKTPKELITKLKKMGNPEGSIMYAASDFSNYIG